jgi:hypothetical protein
MISSSYGLTIFSHISISCMFYDLKLILSSNGFYYYVQYLSCHPVHTYIFSFYLTEILTEEQDMELFV